MKKNTCRSLSFFSSPLRITCEYLAAANPFVRLPLLLFSFLVHLFSSLSFIDAIQISPLSWVKQVVTTSAVKMIFKPFWKRKKRNSSRRSRIRCDKMPPWMTSNWFEPLARVPSVTDTYLEDEDNGFIFFLQVVFFSSNIAREDPTRKSP